MNNRDSLQESYQALLFKKGLTTVQAYEFCWATNYGIFFLYAVFVAQPRPLFTGLKSVNTYLFYLKESIRKTERTQFFISDMQDFQTDLNDIFFKGMIQREMITEAGHAYLATLSPGQVKKQVKNLFLKNFGKLDFIQVGKYHYKFNTYIDMLVRTELKNTIFQAKMNEMKAWGMDTFIRVTVSTMKDNKMFIKALRRIL